MCITVYTTDIARFVSAYLQHHRDVKTYTINPAHAFLQALCEKVGPFLVNVTLDTLKKLLCSIWLLANQESFRGVADRFDMSKGTLHYIFLTFARSFEHWEINTFDGPERMSLQTWQMAFRTKLASLESLEQSNTHSLPSTHTPLKQLHKQERTWKYSTPSSVHITDDVPGCVHWLARVCARC